MKEKDQKPVNLALSELCWINTPVNYTTYSKSYTLLQQDILLRVSGKLQEHFSKYLNEHRYLTDEHPKSGIAKEDLLDMEPLLIRLSDLGVTSSHYDAAVSAISQLERITFHLPRFDNETGLRKGDDYMPIFSKIFVPKSFVSKEGKEYAYNDSGEVKVDERGEVQSQYRREGCIEVTINIEAAKAIFDMDQGYFNHLERIAYFCTSAFTSRLYLALMKYVSKGQMHPAIDYAELKDLLGMYEREERSDVIVREKYKKFSQFRKQVLDVARRDMERLCEENKIEIMLASTDKCPDGYEPLYRGVAGRGNPEKIRFHIKRTPLGVAREQELHRGASEQRLCRKLLDAYPTLNEHRIKTFVADVPDYLWDEFKKYAYYGVPKAVEQPHRWDGSTEEFIYYILGEWVKSHSQKTPALSSAVAQSATPEPAVQAQRPSKPADFPGKYAAEWATLMQTYDGLLKPMLAGARHYGASAMGYVSIIFPDRDALDAFNDACSRDPRAYNELLQALASLVGADAARVLVRGVG